MTDRQNFSAEEWVRVVASPMVASIAVTAAEPSGLWGLLKEALSGGRALLEAKQSSGANSLVKEVAEDVSRSETQVAVRERMRTLFSAAQPIQIRDKAVGELREVATLVRMKAPAEAEGFVSWLNAVAHRAAEASKEGGFLGFGGVLVSDAEKATLADIASALAGPAPESIS